MAKKKTVEPGATAPDRADTPNATPRRRSAARSAQPPRTQSPLTGGAATTSEEVQLAVANNGATGSRQPSYEEIAEAAYRRYMSRGGVHGQDFDDWLQAERELQESRQK